MKHFLGIDVGTTSVKAAVFDEAGRRLALRTVDYALDTDAATGFIEFDADRYAEICLGAVRELRAEVGGLDAISIDTQGETLILADADGRPLCPAIVWQCTLPPVCWRRSTTKQRFPACLARWAKVAPISPEPTMR